MPSRSINAFHYDNLLSLVGPNDVGVHARKMVVDGVFLRVFRSLLNE